MTTLRRLLPALAAMTLAACASVSPVPTIQSPASGWIPAEAGVRSVGLGLPGGARLAEGVTFAGGIELVLADDSPLHSLSDFKIISGPEFVSVSDAGDLVRGVLVRDEAGRLTGVAELMYRRLTLADGSPIVDKVDGDAEGLLITRDGDLLVSFERRHRIWNYGDVREPSARPTVARHPDFDFPLNDGMEGISTGIRDGWRVSAENGGVWDCTPRACTVVTPAPDTPATDGEYRTTGMDRDEAHGGYFIVQRSFAPPLDARAQVRRMAADGSLGPVLVELKLPGTTDNFEGIAAVRNGATTRLYILSDDNNNAPQRTLLLAFDVAN
ncbi:esterase-like activity of phytase family protein [Brevundimonas kwangchunensis]|uniref:Esterase-like activity of phytase family protein n=1 Tax=Brevundimonas kwangchunensis TaxID=322163 RepID=A0ABP3RMT1_9CAUL